MRVLKTQITIIIFFVLQLSQMSFAQPFLISDLAALDFSIDRRARVVYIDHLFSNDVFSYNLTTNKLDTTVYPYCPQFANKNYWAFIHEYGFIDFENDSVLTFENLEDFKGGLSFMFSPNDFGFIGTSGEDNPYSVRANSYYSISDKKLYNSLSESMGLRWERPNPSWSSDTTMMFCTTNRDIIIDVNLKAGEIVDTVLKSHEIVAFKYFPYDDYLLYVNSEYNWQRIWKYNLDSKRSEVFYDFDTENPESHCKGSPFGFESLQWSPNKKKMAFVGFFYTISASGIYCHFSDSNKTYLYGICDDYGKKYNVEWMDNDTIFYWNATEARIYGYDLSSPITSVENDIKLPKAYLSINNYPNPFNPSTTITYSLPQLPNQSLVKIRLLVYDTLGRVITTLVNEKKQSGTYSVTFNAEGLASGVYYYSLITESNVITKPMILIK
ncbi:MAG TPA: T9SS type A sorting domain-containing protein [Ignavibacteria bacterium]|nr:T9SS type A sorting domain-containing protein [Ignavibacteria bacterium]